MPSDFPLPPELQDRFEVDGELGRGAFGAVYRATDRELGRPVAIKLLMASGSAELRARFDREAALLVGMEHPGVVRLYDFGHSPTGPYLVMELLEGRTLEEEGSPDLAEVALQVGAALEAIHRAGAVHRDVKPANIMRTGSGRYVLLDLGLARAEAQATLTRTGAVVGTPAYLAPELWAGALQGPAADWFALGVSLFEKLEGRWPFDVATLMAYGQTGKLPAPRFTRAATPAGLRRLTTALLAPTPSRRPRTARDVARFVREPGTRLAPRPGAAAGLARWRRTWIAAAVLGGIAVGGLLLDPPAAPPPPPPEGTPVQARQRALDTALEEIIGSHRDSAGRLSLYRVDGATGEHLPQIMDGYLEPRYAERVRELLGALVAWLEVAPPADADRHILEAVLPSLVHMAGDERVLSWFRPIPWIFGSAEASDLLRSEEVRSQLGTRREELRTIVTPALEQLARWEDRDAVLLVLATLTWGTPEEEEHRYFRKVVARLEGTRDLAARARLATALVDLAPSADRHVGPFDCPDRRRLTVAMAGTARDLNQPSASFPAALRSHIAGAAVYRHYLDMVTCPAGAAPSAPDELEELLELATAAGEEAPGPAATLLEMAAAYDTVAAIFLPDLGPRFRKLVARIEATAVRFDGMVRQYPREIGFGSEPPAASLSTKEALRTLGAMRGPQGASGPPRGAGLPSPRSPGPGG